MADNTFRLAVITNEFPTVERPDEGYVFYNLCRELQKRCRVRVFGVMPDYPRQSLLRPRTFKPQSLGQPLPGIDVRFTPFPLIPLLSRPFNAISAARHAHSEIARYSPDLILGYFLYPQGCAAVSIGQRLNVPVILAARGSDLLRIPDPLTRRQISAALRSAAAVIGVSRHLVTHAIQLGVHPRRVACIPNGCDPSIFCCRDKRTARRNLGLQEEALYILFVGRLVRLKGVQDLFQALALLKSRRPTLQLLCVGQGPMESELRKLAARLGIVGHVLFAGSKRNDEVGEWLGAADVLCLPSHSEGSPSVILEALSTGRPVVASAVGGIPDLIDDRCGILVHPQSPQRLAAALDAALDRNWGAGEISLRFGRSWSQVAEETLDLCFRFWSQPTAACI